MADSEKNFAIIHVDPLHSRAEIDAAEKHNSRLIRVINADIQRATSNINFREADGKLVDRVATRLKNVGIKPRKNGVQAFEMLMTFSPEMRGKIDEKAWSLASLKWAEERYGADNILHAIHHGDEKTAHLHLVVVPIVQHKGIRNFKNTTRLSYKSIFGGKTLVESRKKLSALQTDYAQAMESFGLRRGIFNSKRQRKTIKELYRETDLLREKAEQDIADVLQEFTALAKARMKIPEQTEVDSEENRVRYAAQLFDELDTLRKKTAAAFAKLVEKASTAWRADDLERERKLFEKKLENEKEELWELLANAKETIQTLHEAGEQKDQIIADLQSQARAIPVGKVIEKLTGLTPRETEDDGQQRFVFADGLRMLIDKGRFKNETPEIPGGGSGGKKAGGKGAIDLLLFLKPWSATEAIEWLAGAFSLKEIGPTVGEMEPTDHRDINRESTQREIKSLTDKSVKAWSALRENLVGQGLDPDMIESLNKANWLNATPGGLVRLTRCEKNSNPEPGASPFKVSGLLVQAPEHTDPALAFRLETGDNGHTPVTRSKNPWVILTDDVIEALAIATREKALPEGKRSTIITIGRQKTPKTEQYLRELAKRFKTIIIAISNTPAAKAFANWISSIIPDAQIRLPQDGLRSHLEALSLPVEPIIPPEKEKQNLHQDPDFWKDDLDSN